MSDAAPGGSSAVRVVAVDLGASSGRVFSADIGPDHLELAEVGRFRNGAVEVSGVLYWDVLHLYRGVLDALRSADRSTPVASVGIDSWAVDYGAVDSAGRLLANPVSHRDPRTARVAAEIIEANGAAHLYGRTGIALQPFNTVFQLAVDKRWGWLASAERVLLIPDLLDFFLCGAQGAERTNASTTGLLRTTGTWDLELLAELGIDAGILPQLHEPGTRLGSLLPAVATELGVTHPIEVIAVASHDTAAAVAAVPAADENFAYISCGTWSLVGVELSEPVLGEAARLAGFTNEVGLDGSIRFLRNVMGLWLHQQSVQTWERRGLSIDLDRLGAEAARLSPLVSVIDPDDPRFLGPGDMPERIATACSELGQVVPVSPAAVTRCILDSLALAYRRAIRRAEELTGRRASVIHIVGGGVNNSLLCQLTADACGRSVIAGPVEAAAIGNALIQGRALGAVSSEPGAIRRRVADHHDLVRYVPDRRIAELFDTWSPGHRGSESLAV